MKPPLVCVDDYRQYARANLDANALAFYESGADDEITLRDSHEVYSRYVIWPRVLAGLSAERDLSTTILGYPVNMPVCVSPVAVQQLAHPDGEVGSARGRPQVVASATLLALYIIVYRIGLTSIDSKTENRDNGSKK